MPRRLQIRVWVATALLAVIVAGACDDRTTPMAPAEERAPLLNVITCRADVAAGALSCEGPTGSPASGPSLSYVYGGQGTFVRLASDNVDYNGGTGVFEADVTVQNLITQPIGTPDGTAVTGVRVFFHLGPTVTGGTGTVSVANEDGTRAFTASDQPYFEYDAILQQNEVSAAKTWQWSVPPTVGTFEFSVYVDTDIPLVDVWKFRYEHQLGSPNPVLNVDGLVMMAILLPEQNGEALTGDARRVVAWSVHCDIANNTCQPFGPDSLVQTPLTGSIHGSEVELRFEAYPGFDPITFSGTYHPVRDSMGGDNWYAIRSTEPPPPVVAAPTALSASIDAGPRVRLEWTDNSSNELGFRVYQGCAGAPLALFGTLGADRETGWVWGLTDHYEQSCSYAITGYTQDGAWGIVESDSSNVETVQIPLGPISGIQPAAGSVGNAVVITGSGFSPGVDVYVNQRLANLFLVGWNDSQILMLIPNAGYVGRVPVTVVKDGAIYGEVAWWQNHAEDSYCYGEDRNDSWPAPCNDPLPIDVVGSFAFGDVVDHWGVRLAYPNVVDTLVFYLDWDDPSVDLDLYVGRQTLNNVGDYYLYYYCESSGGGMSKPVAFACIVRGEAIYGDIIVQVRNRTAEAGDPRLVSYRLRVNQYP